MAFDDETPRLDWGSAATRPDQRSRGETGGHRPRGSALEVHHKAPAGGRLDALSGSERAVLDWTGELRQPKVNGFFIPLQISFMTHLEPRDQIMGSKSDAVTPNLFVHGSKHHESISVDTYNAELKDADGFIGDRASKRAFLSILEKRREQVRQVGDDPLGEAATEDLKKKDLEKALTDGDLEAAGVVHGAIEEFSQELSLVANRLLKLKGWRDTERIVVGGGLSSGRVGELAIKRASVLLQAVYGHGFALTPIRHHPDEAGLLGNIHVVPSWMLSGYDSLLAVDIGGSNMRVGVVALNQAQSSDFKEARVSSTELWRHADDDLKRDACIERLAGMLEVQIKLAKKEGCALAPLIGIACPGFINNDGSIEKGAQNLPGNWESSRFNLPETIKSLIPKIGDHETIVTMHNDAVVQGLSETPWMQDVTHWGVLTIGTGLGNARFTNRFQSKGKWPRMPQSRRPKGE